MESYGIDVSHHQGDIKWQQVAAAGKKFAVIKATEGTNWTDPAFRHNWTLASTSGLKVGAYHYFRPGLDPIAQARHFYKKVGKLEAENLIPWLDVEDEHSSINGPAMPFTIVMRDLVQLYSECVNLFACPIGIYTGQWFWNRLPEPYKFAAAPLWVAYWFTDQSAGGSFPLPKGWGNYVIHQYTSKGRVPGIVGNVDLDYAPNFSKVLVGGSNGNKIAEAVALLEQAVELLKEHE